MKAAPALLALVLLAVGPAFAQSASEALPSGWMAESRTGCKLWNPQPQPDESVRWSGGCKDGLADGPGVTEWVEQGLVTETTQGPRVAGHLEGSGVQTFANGDRFEGSWKQDGKDGHGTYTAADGRSYVGGFKDDRFEGFGVLTDGQGGLRGRLEGRPPQRGGGADRGRRDARHRRLDRRRAGGRAGAGAVGASPDWPVAPVPRRSTPMSTDTPLLSRRPRLTSQASRLAARPALGGQITKRGLGRY